MNTTYCAGSFLAQAMLCQLDGTKPFLGRMSLNCQMGSWEKTWVKHDTSAGIDADASKGQTSPGYFNSKLVYCSKCDIPITAWNTPFLHHRTIYSGTIFFSPRIPWDCPGIFSYFPEGTQCLVFGKTFWSPHTPSPFSQPGPHLPPKLTILCFSVVLSFNYSFWEFRRYL